MTESLVGAAAAPLSMRATAVAASAVVRAARQLLSDLERGRRIDAVLLRSAMEAAFGASDAAGAWNWKTAYDACEAATVRPWADAPAACAGRDDASLSAMLMTKLMGLNMMRRDGEAWVAQPARADRAVAWIPLISLWFGFVHEPIGAGDRGAAGQGQREAAFGLQKATASAHPEIPEDVIHGYRRINQFYDKWNTAALRLKEKSFDNAHFAFVHKGTFGDINQPKPEKYEIIETDSGFDAETIITVRNPPNAYRITGSTEPTTRRHQRNKWFMPFCRRLDMEYPSGIRHIIFNCATPISDGQIQVIQLLYRNDTEADCSTQELIDWDAAIIAEDRDMLESTDPDAIVDMSRKIQIHMPSDCPGMIMRKRLLQLLRAHGEEEQPREPV